jgi:DNA-binding response OmpR family regulator
MDTILVVEDDQAVQKTLRRLFEYDGYKVEVRGDGKSALDAFRTATPKAVILDLGLPVLSGKDVCREIRRRTISVPIVILSALTDESDKILLLELGADDYVTKPFSPRELLARVRAAIRRTPLGTSVESQRTEFGSACVDFTRMQATFAGRPIELTAHEFRMLGFLVHNEDRVVHRDEILTKIFGCDSSTQTRTMDNVILRLRQKLEDDPANPTHILTVRSIGYRFKR